MNEEEEGLANLGLHSFLHKQNKTKHAYTHGHHTHIPENGSGEGQRVKKIKREEHHGTESENRSSPSYSLLGQSLS